MPRNVVTTVYKFEELSDAAKERAREWWRESDSDDTYWSESVIEDFEEALTACGFDVERSRGSRSKPAIYFEGFSHQGSGASFTASWQASRVNVAALIANRPVSYKDAQGVEQPSECNARLVSLLQRMDALAQADTEAYGNTKASNRGHSQSSEWNGGYVGDGSVEAVQMAEDFDELCDDLANHLYRSLETEYDYRNADEQVDESIVINDYEFLEDGSRA